MARIRISKKLAAVVLLLICAEVLLARSIRSGHFPSLDRIETVAAAEFRSPSAKTVYHYDQRYKKDFLSLIRGRMTTSVRNFSIEEAVSVREQLLDLHANTGELVRTNDPRELFNAIARGDKLLCSELAQLYGIVLNSLGFTVRIAGVSRSVFDAFDSHAFVEVYDPTRQKWILSDPTFNVCFQRNGEYLSSDELYDAIHGGDRASIVTVPGNPTKYEYSLDEYYISYYSLFDNLFFTSHAGLSGWSKYPPLRWFDGRRKMGLVMTDTHPVQGGDVAIHNAMVLFAVLMNPLAIIGLSIGCLRRSQRGSRRSSARGRSRATRSAPARLTTMK